MADIDRNLREKEAALKRIEQNKEQEKHLREREVAERNA